MTILYGFELEGFFGESGPRVPPKSYPTDGFPGLVELRTNGGASLGEAWSEICRLDLEYPGVDYSCYAHTFNREDRADIRRRHNEKSAWDIRNLYGKRPRLLGNKTLASCQISVSNRLYPSYKDDKGVVHTDRWGLLDIPKIVRALDEEFREEIKGSGRQPGEYCVKDGIRLEYRSLPNAAFHFDVSGARTFLRRIRLCVEDI